MQNESFDYGNWAEVIFYSAIFIIFALSFTRPKISRDWRSFGAFSAFIVALFVEMYGLPLTIYLLSGWLQRRLPDVDLFEHEAGHLWHTIFNLRGHAHTHPLYVLATIFIIGGLAILGFAWSVLYKAQRARTLATTGLYGRIRHPQYLAFIMIMFGYLLTWPTLPTLVMFPLLVFMYVRLAKREEREAEAEFGKAYSSYAAATPAFFPRFGMKS